ncbi:hypothetical protein PTI98_012744 [Pleurotus ostreatus]|nr:hypothetical protein PTI98_012744 [Pleurotus ostreatus]
MGVGSVYGWSPMRGNRALSIAQLCYTFVQQVCTSLQQKRGTAGISEQLTNKKLDDQLEIYRVIIKDSTVLAKTNVQTKSKKLDALRDALARLAVKGDPEALKTTALAEGLRDLAVEGEAETMLVVKDWEEQVEAEDDDL